MSRIEIESLLQKIQSSVQRFQIEANTEEMVLHEHLLQLGDRLRVCLLSRCANLEVLKCPTHVRSSERILITSVLVK